MEPGASCQIIILKKGLKNYDENITDSHTGKLHFCQLSDREKSCTGVHGHLCPLQNCSVTDTRSEERPLQMEKHETSYFETSVLTHARKRFMWLLFLMLSATVTGTIITKYENAFSAVPLLVSFIPMLMDTGGNCGSQSSTLIIRGLALNEIRPRDIFRIAFKEFRIALLVGTGLAVINGIRILIMYRDPRLALVVSLSLTATVILSKIIGCLLPLGAKTLHMDPAIMASPLITTAVDTCSIIIYFYIATRIFSLAV